MMDCVFSSLLLLQGDLRCLTFKSPKRSLKKMKVIKQDSSAGNKVDILHISQQEMTLPLQAAAHVTALSTK
ncbi:hypothetical protein XELAEV_18021077mg [Xenopus laevis]|uniref:Uncharacterized protein n=1 Tax=Xenopus laevis TaxID=8355 RepID=A0A974HR14_XENLA|nr:hypothetical protein XELAEV_18021077mg [Xenopus laevis]